MKPTRTPTSNLTLTLTGPDGQRDPDADLPAERCIDPQGRHLYETSWTPDEGERRAIANAAPVILHVWGTNHPPVSLKAGDPPENIGAGVLLGDHVNRALGYLFAELADHSGRHDRTHIDLLNGSHITPDQFISRFHAALLHTATHPDE